MFSSRTSNQNIINQGDGSKCLYANDIHALRYCLVYDRIGDKRLQPKNFDMGHTFDKAVSNNQITDTKKESSFPEWDWNLATVIGSKFYKFENGKTFDELETSEINYRICYYNAGLKNAQKVAKIIDASQKPSFLEKLQWDMSGHGGRGLQEMYFHNTMGILEAEEYLDRNAHLMGSAIVREKNENDFNIEIGNGKQTFTVPSLRAFECTL